ncbi:hypothetical protein Acsp06_43110 [Actinomycetospora sp. NBRC 106375]|uniref:PaaI family thioesterase n=1 Tax=Actinomycetospora sp. NBRC 106375 TaxID=3032207 RepID=UPI0024A4A7B8|nr:hotdog fold thioesterase [Actinomycetospora sp. NBRC 106375]GLZ48126.1 hypothetical protein Acsp06_43110 [Actinomycetospora sp. NBRC 106375]
MGGDATIPVRGPLLITPRGTPEVLFGLAPVEADGDVARGSMRTAPWMTDARGRPCAGMVGVLVDDVVGQATLTARPDAHWPVTTELSVDVVSELPADGTVLTAESRLLAAGARTGSARGEVRDASGAVVAVATVAVQYVPGVPELTEAADGGDGTAASGRRLPDVLGATVGSRPGRDARLTAPPGPALANTAGHGHGGVLAALADVVAAAAVADDARPLRTAGLRVAYLRPAVLDGPMCLDARVVHRGRTSALTRVDVVGGDGRQCAAATVTAAAIG